jgi:tetratricopeptide (TPR) repeat protein
MTHRFLIFAAVALAAVALAAVVPDACAFEACGPLENSYGPYDYRTQRDKLAIVERFHFTQPVQMLDEQRATNLGGNLDYTLRASPNHPGALWAMATLSLRQKRDRVSGAEYSIECYFDRAMRFAPTDGTVYMIYGNWLFKTGRRDKAIAEYQIAEKYAENNANLHYNLGLVYFDVGDYGKALAQAHIAYDLGFQLEGLRKKLTAAGKWRDETPQPAAGTTQSQK